MIYIKINYIFTSCIEKFIKIKSKDFMGLLKDNFKEIFSEYPEIEQQKSLKPSIVFLKKVFNHKEFYDLIIAFEYRLPFCNERMDFFIILKRKRSKRHNYTF